MQKISMLSDKFFHSRRDGHKPYARSFGGKIAKSYAVDIRHDLAIPFATKRARDNSMVSPCQLIAASE